MAIQDIGVIVTGVKPTGLTIPLVYLGQGHELGRVSQSIPDSKAKNYPFAFLRSIVYLLSGFVAFGNRASKNQSCIPIFIINFYIYKGL
jgi:hypothetical protein